MRAVRVNEFGDPGVYTLSEVDEPTAGPGQVIVEVTVSGANYLDVYQRTGPLRPPFGAGV